MTMIIGKNQAADGLLNEVKEISGVDVSGCLQCKKCTNGCPVTTRINVPPSEIIRKLQLNMGNSILDTGLVWMCVSCETCFSRCPMKIDMAAVMDALRNIALRKNKPGRKENVALFDKWFLRTVKYFGRAYDLGMIAAYKMETSNYFQDADKFPMMLRKRKIALLPSFKADKKYLSRIFRKIK
jgi:heterodisulfide reductase subunit C2